MNMHAKDTYNPELKTAVVHAAKLALADVAQRFGLDPALVEQWQGLPPERGATDLADRRDQTSAEIRRDLGIGSVRDVRERKAIEDRLRESESRYRALFESIDQGVCLIEMMFDGTGRAVDYRILETNRVFEQLTGIHGAVGRTIREVVPQIDQFWIDTCAAVARSGTPARIEYYSRVSHRWFDVHAVRIGEAAGGRVAVLSSEVTDRKHTEEVLRESERSIRLLADSMPQLVWVAKADGTATYYNQRAREYIGIWQRADGNWEWRDAIHPDDLQATEDAWHRAATEKTPFSIEHRVRLADGTTRWHLSRAVPVQDEVHGFRWFGTTTDIHDIKLVEQSLRASEERNRLIARATNDVIWDWDLANGRLYWNEALHQHFGYKPEELDPSIDGWSSRLHPDDRDRVVAGIHDAIDRGRDCWEDEYRFRRSDGTYAYVVDRGYIARDTATGEACRMIGSMLDMTERRQAEEELRRSEGQFRQLADVMPQMVWITRADGYHEYFNRRWFDFTGIDLAASRGEEWLTLLHPDDRAPTLNVWRHSLATGEPYQVEYRFRRTDGVYHWFLCRALPVRDSQGRIVRWFGTSTDIEELKRAQAVLRDADQRKDEFLAMLGHELRNPLASLTLAVEMLDRPDMAEDRAAQLRALSRRQVRNLGRLVDDLLDVSRITRGKIALKYERIDLRTVAQRALQDVQVRFDDKHHVVDVRLPARPVDVVGDPVRLEQVLTNLLTNAAKYTDPGGRITLQLRREDSMAILRVRDTGIGLPPDAIDSVFELFGQAEHGLDRAHGGLGIGLTVVRSLVELHGGRVDAYSAGLGKGAEFVVSLPLAPAAGHTAPQASGCEAPCAARRVLVIDDNADTANALALLLKNAGHTVSVAHDGPSGLGKADELEPDLILLDIGLPGMDGYQVAERLRQNPRTRDAVLAALTGYGESGDRERAVEAGFDAHFVKPVDAGTLANFVRDAQPHRAERERLPK